MKFDEIKFLLKHSSIYGLGSVIGQAISFLLLPLYTQYLTPSDYGTMALVDVVKGLIGLVISLGMVSALGRFYYEYDDEKNRNVIISSAYWVVIITILLFLPLVWYLSPVFSELIFHTIEYARIFQVALLSLLFGLLVDLGMDYLRVRAESVKFIKITLIRLIVAVSCNIYFIVFLQTGVIGIFYSSLLVSVIFGISLSFMVLRKTGLFFSLKHAIEMIQYSFPLIFSNIFRVIVNESDKLFINFFFSPFETGIYFIAQRVGTAIHLLLTSPFLQTYLPRRFQIMKGTNAQLIYASILDYYLLVICTAGLMVCVFSREIIMLMTTKEYYSAIVYIPAIVLSIVIFGMKYHFEVGILLKKQTKLLAYINGFSCGINILLNWLLIKRFGIAGAIVSVNLSYLLTTILSLAASRQLYPIPFNFRGIFRLFTLCLTIFLFSLLISQDSLFWAIVTKSILCVCYFFLLYIIKLVPRELVDGIKTRMSKRGTASN